jgi:hypothetical protein
MYYQEIATWQKHRFYFIKPATFHGFHASNTSNASESPALQSEVTKWLLME